jgi:hypothetical protein
LIGFPAWSRIKELQMSNQAQIDAVEHLLLTVLKRTKMTLQTEQVFADAQASVMGSDGPGGPQQKEEAAEYLAQLKVRLA